MDRQSAGRGILRFEKNGSRTVATETFSKSPLKFLAPKNSGHAAWVYSSSFGGGFVGGDEINMDIELGPETHGVLLTQASTKVYKADVECRQKISAKVGKGAVYYCIPDPVVCFSGAKFRQEQTLELDKNASLVLVDTLHCGREHSGERWSFDHYQNRIRVMREGKSIFLESQFLHPSMGDLVKRHSRFNALSLVFLSGPAFRNESRNIISLISARPVGDKEDFICAASPVGDDGVVVRMAAVSTESLALATRELLHFLPERLGDDPWSRKW